MNKRQIVREVVLIPAGAVVILTLLGLAYGVAVDINPKAFLTEPSGPSTGERFARPKPANSPAVAVSATESAVRSTPGRARM